MKPGLGSCVAATEVVAVDVPIVEQEASEAAMVA
jgi:hypothetical protein